METTALSNYLTKHASQITEDWMNTRACEKPGSFYSSQPSADIDRLLRIQHQQTVNLLISSFEANEREFQNKLEDWAQTVAKSRVDKRIHIHQVIKFLQKTRKIFWQYIQRYIGLKDDSLCENLVAEWSDILHSAFDEMILKFSEYYHEFNEQRLSEHQELIKLLEIPLIKVSDKVSVLPVIGVLNSDRGFSLLNEAPLKVNEARVKSLIIDLSGVSQIEEAVATQLTQLVQVLRMMGIQCYISGIRPEVARNSMSFGQDFHQITKIRSIQDVM